MAPLNEIICDSLFANLGDRTRITPSIRISINEHTYLPDGEIEEGWLPLSLAAFQKLAATGWRPETACSIGAGSGLDAICVLEILAPHRFIVTDLRDDVAQLARANILQNSIDLKPADVVGFAGDLCEGLRQRKLKADLIYENLPNLPASSGNVNVSHGCLSASFFDPAKDVDVPEEFRQAMLSLHYLFLQQARSCLTPGGRVVCSIGARVSSFTIMRMFESLGYRPEVVELDMVLQLQADKVLPSYAETESSKKGSFSFYPFENGKESLHKLLEQSADVHNVIAEMERSDLRRSAEEAVILCLNNQKVGHIGLVVQGTSV